MVDIDDTDAAELCGDIALKTGPLGLNWLLIMVDPDGNVAHLSDLPPHASRKLVEHLAENWSPEAVDNIRVFP